MKNKEKILRNIINNTYHGAVKNKELECVPIGATGMITAYLPEEETFSVFFKDKIWLTFNEDEESFKNRFEILEVI